MLWYTSLAGSDIGLNSKCAVLSLKFVFRTDSGVHAFNTTVHVDLQRRTGNYEPLEITHQLNSFFRKNTLPIHVLKTQAVPPTFHCRFSAINRTYLYRFAIVRADFRQGYFVNFPVEENKRCFFVW